VYGKSEGKIFQDKIQACRHINVAAMIYEKFKLQLKFRNVKIIVL
jgi:hypothetical protein